VKLKLWHYVIATVAILAIVGLLSLSIGVDLFGMHRTLR